MVVLNGMYCDAPVGTGTFTQTLSSLLPRARVWRASFNPSARGRLRYVRKLVTEASLRYRDRASIWVHPYLAVGAHSLSVVSVLDLVHYRATSVPNRLLLRRSVEQAGGLLAISSAIAAQVRTEFGREPVVVNPIPAAAFFDPPTKRITTSPLRIAYWGGWHPRKQIAAAIQELAQTSRTPIELIALGAEGTTSPSARLRVVAVPRGDLRHLIRVIDSCDISLYPSIEEGFGLPVAESLLRDRPVVVRDLPSYSDFVRPGAPGLVAFGAESGRSLSQAVEEAASLASGSARASLNLTDHAAALAAGRRQIAEIELLQSAIGDS